MNDNRKISLVLACLSLAASLLVTSYITRFQYSPVVVIFPFISLAGVIGVLLKNKDILIASTLISLAVTNLGIMTVGGLFVSSSLSLIISTFVYQCDSRKQDVDEKAKRNSILMLIASFFIALLAASSEAPWMYRKAISMGLMVSDFDFIFLLSLLIILPVLGLIGVRDGNKDHLNTAAAISIVPAIFMGLLLQKFLFPVSCALLVISTFVYRSGTRTEIIKEAIDPRLKRIALVLAITSLLAAVMTTFYSEITLIIDGCYTYQASSTAIGTICSDFRPDYVIPVTLTAIGIAGILMENKILLYASATVSFVRMVVYLSPIGVLFVPSFVSIIISAFIYQRGIGKGTAGDAIDNRKQLYFLLFLLAFVIIWVIAVYIFVQPGDSNSFSGYDTMPSREHNNSPLSYSILGFF